MNWIQLTNGDGTGYPLYLRASAITAIDPLDEYTLVYTGKTGHRVNESISEILGALEAAGALAWIVKAEGKKSTVEVK